MHARYHLVNTLDDLHNSDSFENIPRMLTRQSVHAVGGKTGQPAVTHCIQSSREHEERGPVTLERMVKYAE